MEDCLAQYNPATDTAKSVDFIKWMYDTRSHLDEVYDLKDGYIVTDNYLAKASVTVQSNYYQAACALPQFWKNCFTHLPRS